MLRVERNKPNIFCVGGVQFKPGVTEVSDKDATKLMATRQFKGAISNGDMTILSYDKQPEIAEKAEKVVTPKRKPPVSRKTAIKIVNSCSSVEELEKMLENQKDNTVRKAIKDRIILLSAEDIDEDAE